jgi:hypothetical protein
LSVEKGAVLRAVATFSLGTGTKAQNRYHMAMMTDDPVADSDVVDAALNWIEAIMAPMENDISNTVSLDKVEVYEAVEGDWQPLGEVIGTFAGAGTNERLPSGCAGILTASKERSGYLDRKYIAGFTEACVNGDNWGSSTVDHMEAAATVWVTYWEDTNGVELQPLSVNYKTGIGTFLVSGGASYRVGYQRRRKPGVGLS